MSEAQQIFFKADGDIRKIDIDITGTEIAPVLEDDDSDYDEERGLGTDTIAKMQQAQKMIRGYTLYVLNAFKDFGAAEIGEITLKFGMKLGGSAGIPYITEGKAESNLEIEVKCKFPDKKTGTQP